MKKIIVIKLVLTGKGEVKNATFSLPNNAKKITGISIINNVRASAFPPAPPYVIPAPTKSAVSQLNLEATQKLVLDALNNMSGNTQSNLSKIKSSNDYQRFINYNAPPHQQLEASIVHSSAFLALSVTEILTYANLVTPPYDTRLIQTNLI